MKETIYNISYLYSIKNDQFYMTRQSGPFIWSQRLNLLGLLRHDLAYFNFEPFITIESAAQTSQRSESIKLILFIHIQIIIWYVISRKVHDVYAYVFQRCTQVLNIIWSTEYSLPTKWHPCTFVHFLNIIIKGDKKKSFLYNLRKLMKLIQFRQITHYTFCYF